MKTQAIKYLNGLVGNETTKGEIDLIDFIKKCVNSYCEKPKPDSSNDEYIDELYKKFYDIYRRKGSREQGRKTFHKKLCKIKDREQILEKARKIAKLYSQYDKMWEAEGTEKRFIPLISSWLNSNVPD